MRLSVLICTLDRPIELRRCLNALVAQAAQPHEVIVLDNSHDGSAFEVAAEFAVGYTHERRRGLCVARNAARRAATGDILAFLDDDAIPRPGWIDELHRFFESRVADGVGGPVHQVMPAGTDARVVQFYNALEASLYGGPIARPYASHESPLGGNCAISAVAFDAVEGFDERISLYFDEVDFFQRIREVGFTLAYEPRLVVDHTPPAITLGWRGFMSRGYNHGRGTAQTKDRDRGEAAGHFCRAMGLGVLGVMTRRWDRLFACSAELGRARELIM